MFTKKNFIENNLLPALPKFESWIENCKLLGKSSVLLTKKAPSNLCNLNSSLSHEKCIKNAQNIQ